MDAGFALKHWNMVLIQTTRKSMHKKPNCRAESQDLTAQEIGDQPGRRGTCLGPCGFSCSAVLGQAARGSVHAARPACLQPRGHGASAACLFWSGLGLGGFARPHFFGIQRANYGIEQVPSRGSQERGNLAKPFSPQKKDPNPLGRIRRSPRRDSWASHSFIYC